MSAEQRREERVTVGRNTAEIRFTMSTEHLEKALRIVSKHADACADELAELGRTLPFADHELVKTPPSDGDAGYVCPQCGLGPEDCAVYAERTHTGPVAAATDVDIDDD